MKIKQTKIPALAAVLLLAGAAFAALPSDISVDLKLDDISFVAGERMRGVVSLRNMSPVKLSGGGTNTQDRLFIEVFRASDYHQIEPFGSRAYVASFDLAPNEGQRLETYIGDHYELLEPEHPALYVYTRTLGDESLLVVCNFSEDEQAYDIPAEYRGADILIANYPDAAPSGKLRPWEAVVYHRK